MQDLSHRFMCSCCSCCFVGEAFRRWNLLEFTQFPVCHSGKALRLAIPALLSDSIQCDRHCSLLCLISPSLRNLEDKHSSLSASGQASALSNDT